MSANNYILTSDGNFVSEDELYHYGVLGMKWGIRRYQNADGSLTNAGKKRAERKLNKLFEKSDKAISKYKSYDRQYKLADAGAKKSINSITIWKMGHVRCENGQNNSSE